MKRETSERERERDRDIEEEARREIVLALQRDIEKQGRRETVLRASTPDAEAKTIRHSKETLQRPSVFVYRSGEGGYRMSFVPHLPYRPPSVLPPHLFDEDSLPPDKRHVQRGC